MFNRRSHHIEKTDNINEDDLMMEALEAGAEDIVTEDYFEIATQPNDFSAVRIALESKGCEFRKLKYQWFP